MGSDLFTTKISCDKPYEAFLNWDERKMVKGENREPKYGKHIGQKQELIPALVSMRKTKNTKYVNHLVDTIRYLKQKYEQLVPWSVCRTNRNGKRFAFSLIARQP